MGSVHVVDAYRVGRHAWLFWHGDTGDSGRILQLPELGRKVVEVLECGGCIANLVELRPRRGRRRSGERHDSGRTDGNHKNRNSHAHFVLLSSSDSTL